MAAGAYAEDDTLPAPPELSWAFTSDKYGLPYPGSWLEQPAGMLNRITAAKNTYLAVKEWYGANDWVAFKSKNPVKWRTVLEYLTVKQNANF